MLGAKRRALRRSRKPCQGQVVYVEKQGGGTAFAVLFLAAPDLLSGRSSCSERSESFAAQLQALLGALVNSSNQNKEVVIIFFVQVCQKPRSGISCASAFGCAGVADKKMKANFT